MRLRCATQTATRSAVGVPFRIKESPRWVVNRWVPAQKKLEYGPGAIYAGVRSSLGFEVGGQSYSNFLAATVSPHTRLLQAYKDNAAIFGL